MGSTGLGAHWAQPNPSCKRTNLPPSSFTYQTFLLLPPHPLWSPKPWASPLLRASPELLGRESNLPV